MKKIAAIFIFFTFVFLSTTGCIQEEQSDQNKFIGVWLPEEELYKSKRFEFFEDGTCHVRTYKLEGTYEINETLKKLTINVDEISQTFVYSYTLFNDKLTLTNEDTYDIIVYIKQD